MTMPFDIDPVSLLAATAAAGLLVGGGALLRGKARVSAPTEARSPGDTSANDLSRGELESRLRLAEEALVAARSQIAEVQAANDAQRAEAVAMRQRLERQAQSAEMDASRLSVEVDVQRGRVLDAERQGDEDRIKLTDLEKELARLREQRGEVESSAEQAESAAKAKAEQAELVAKAKAEQSELVAKAKAEQDDLVAKAKAEQSELAAKIQELERRVSELAAERDAAQVMHVGKVEELERRVSELVGERDLAKTKAEAAERLIEGVRARSRELSNELKALKAQAVR